MKRKRIIVIGAGMGGLAAAADLAHSGFDVEVLERALKPGGKMRQLSVSEFGIDAGPTVFTMRWILEKLFADCGSSLKEYLALTPANLLARHGWSDGSRLDLFADVAQSAEAIRAFAGSREADGYRCFCQKSREIFETLNGTFIEAQRPGPVDLVRRAGFGGLGAMLRTMPYQTMWQALGQFFKDPRLKQLFGRYATYCGSSPFAAPATLMLVAHVEQAGVWLVEGGMVKVAEALQFLGEGNGARYRFGAEVSEILMSGGRVSGVRLADGETIPADAVLFNGDVSALGQGMLGRPLAGTAPITRPAERSLSAIVWCTAAKSSGFPLAHHNVFFGPDYEIEFRSIFAEGRICRQPTVYICAQQRGDASPDADQPEPLMLLINAPARGDAQAYGSEEMTDFRQRCLSVLRSCGLKIEGDLEQSVVTTPSEFAALFPGSGGALYGRANHGTFASFQRAGAKSAVPGLYLAGGSVHPGPGVPMAAMSGRLAAAQMKRDLS